MIFITDAQINQNQSDKADKTNITPTHPQSDDLEIIIQMTMNSEMYFNRFVSEMVRKVTHSASLCSFSHSFFDIFTS